MLRPGGSQANIIVLVVVLEFTRAAQSAVLFFCAGVSQGIDLAACMLSQPGDVIAVECPTYFLVRPVFSDHHLSMQVRCIRLGR